MRGDRGLADAALFSKDRDAIGGSFRRLDRFGLLRLRRRRRGDAGRRMTRPANLAMRKGDDRAIDEFFFSFRRGVFEHSDGGGGKRRVDDIDAKVEC